MTRSPPDRRLHDAVKERGRAYLVVSREPARRYGEAEAIEVMRGASYAHGRMIGEALADFAPRGFAGLAEACAKAPDGGATFSPDIRELSDRCLTRITEKPRPWTARLHPLMTWHHRRSRRA